MAPCAAKCEKKVNAHSFLYMNLKTNSDVNIAFTFVKYAFSQNVKTWYGILKYIKCINNGQ